MQNIFKEYKCQVQIIVTLFRNFLEVHSTSISLPLCDVFALQELILIKQNSSEIPHRLSADNLVQIFSVAVYFLEIKIAEKIIERLTENVDNVAQVMSIILLREELSLPNFNTHALYSFIDMNFWEIAQTTSWVHLEIGTVRKILNRRTLHVENELEVLRSIRKWVDFNYPSDDDDLNFEMREKTLRDLSRYLCEPSDEVQDLFKTQPDPEYRNRFESDPISEEWQWLKDELDDRHWWKKFLEFETFSVRQNPNAPEPSYFICRRNGITKVAQMVNAPSSNVKILCDVGEDKDPGHGGHIAPYYSEWGPTIIFFGGNLRRRVWLYVIALDGWFKLSDAPRNILFAGVQVVADQLFVIGGYGKCESSDLPNVSKRKDILKFNIPHLRFLDQCRENEVVQPRAGHWESYECPAIARCHHTAANVSRLDFMTLRKTEKKRKATHKKFARDFLCIAVVGGGDWRNACRLSCNDEEYVTLISLGSDSPHTDLSMDHLTNSDLLTSHMTFVELRAILRKYQDPMGDIFVLGSATKLGTSREQLVLSGALPINVENSFLANISIPLDSIVLETLSRSKNKTVSFIGRLDMLKLKCN